MSCTGELAAADRKSEYTWLMHTEEAHLDADAEEEAHVDADAEVVHVDAKETQVDDGGDTEAALVRQIERDSSDGETHAEGSGVEVAHAEDSGYGSGFEEHRVEQVEVATALVKAVNAEAAAEAEEATAKAEEAIEKAEEATEEAKEAAEEIKQAAASGAEQATDKTEEAIKPQAEEPTEVAKEATKPQAEKATQKAAEVAKEAIEVAELATKVAKEASEEIKLAKAEREEAPEVQAKVAAIAPAASVSAAYQLMVPLPCPLSCAAMRSK